MRDELYKRTYPRGFFFNDDDLLMTKTDNMFFLLAAGPATQLNQLVKIKKAMQAITKETIIIINQPIYPIGLFWMDSIQQPPLFVQSRLSLAWIIFLCFEISLPPCIGHLD